MTKCLVCGKYFKGIHILYCTQCIDKLIMKEMIKLKPQTDLTDKSWRDRPPLL